MLSSRTRLLALLKGADLVVVAASFIAATIIADPTTIARGHILDMSFTLQDLLFAAAYLAVWHGVFAGRGLYESYRLSAASRELRDLFIAVVVAVSPLLLASLFFPFSLDPGVFLATFSAIALVSLGIERRTLRAIGRRLRRYGRNLRNVIIVGTGDEAVDLASKLTRREDLGYQVVEVVDTGSGVNGNGHATPGAIIRRVEALLKLQPIDEIFVSLPLDTTHSLTRRLISVCEEQGITVRVVAHVANLCWAHARVDEIEGQPVLTMYTGEPEALGLVVKRAIDILASTVGLVLLSPVFLVVALLIKLDSPGPVFFAQERVGYNRRRFPAYKFRTMVYGAEKMQAALEPLNEAQGPVFKIANDPRVTRLGKWLRRLSIDEFPQLLNVLKGEMSLVGPRPLPVRDVERIDVRWHKRRFAVKPGITCLWQVNSRQPQFDDWVRSDMEYIDNWSLALDLKILARTIPAVLSGQGAQ